MTEDVHPMVDAIHEFVKSCEMEFKTIFLVLITLLCSANSTVLADSGRIDSSRARAQSPKRVTVQHVHGAKSWRESSEIRALIARERTNSQLDNLELIAQLETQNQAYQERITFFKYACLFCISLILGLGLVFYSIWSRDRLKKVSRELAQEHLQREVLEKRINHLQRMESLGMLASGVAHDFNNLLVGVICNAEILEAESYSSPNNQYNKERLEQIIQSAEKAADLSRQMLAYAGKTQIVKTPTELNVLISRMQGVLMSTLGEKMQLELDLSPDQIVSNIDPTQIEQILLNLVSNARQASHGEGEVIIRTGIENIVSVQADEALFGTRETGGKFVFFEVEDSGDGIPSDKLKRIFDPFFTSRDDGRGLGLAVVYGVVKGHHGLIRAQTVPGEGTCFRILLPYSTSSLNGHPQQAPNPNTQSDFDLRNSEDLKILVVDDEPSVRDTAKALLLSQGWQVELASNGIEALEVLEQKTDDPFDCILLDVMMPKMGAKEVLEQMQLNDVSSSVVLMSGHSETQLDPYRQSDEVSTVLSKPFNSQELIQAISLAVASRYPQNHRI